MKKQIILLIALVMVFPCLMQAMSTPQNSPVKDSRKQEHAAKFGTPTKKDRKRKMSQAYRKMTVTFERRNRQRKVSQHLIEGKDFSLPAAAARGN